MPDGRTAPEGSTLVGMGVGARVTADDSPKRPEPPAGEHDWQMLVQFRLTTEEAEQARDGTIVLDTDLIADWSPVLCLRCEHPWAHAAQYECPGEPAGYRKDGRPYWVTGGTKTTWPWRPKGADDV